MAKSQNHELDRAREANDSFLGSLYTNLRLIVRLLKDRRVNFFLKILPIGALIYLLVPTDFLPVNPVDDAVVVWLGGYLFIELCPDEVVAEHRKALGQDFEEDDNLSNTSSEVIDGEYKDLSTSDQK